MKLEDILTTCDLSKFPEWINSCTLDSCDGSVTVHHSSYEGAVSLATITEIVCKRFSTKDIPAKLTMWFEHIYMEPKIYQNLSNAEKKALEVFRDTFQKHPTIQDLPTELLNQCIVKYDTDNELLTASSVCSKWQTVVLGDQHEKTRLFLLKIHEFVTWMYKNAVEEKHVFVAVMVSALAKKGFVDEAIELSRLFPQQIDQNVVLLDVLKDYSDELPPATLDKIFKTLLHEAALSQTTNDATIYTVRAYVTKGLYDEAILAFLEWYVPRNDTSCEKVFYSVIEHCIDEKRATSALTLLEHARRQIPYRILEKIAILYLEAKKFDWVYNFLSERSLQPLNESAAILFAKYGDYAHAWEIYTNADGIFYDFKPFEEELIKCTPLEFLIETSLHGDGHIRDRASILCMRSLLEKGMIDKAISFMKECDDSSLPVSISRNSLFWNNDDQLRLRQVFRNNRRQSTQAKILLPYLFFSNNRHEIKNIIATKIIKCIDAEVTEFTDNLKELIKDSFRYSTMKISFLSFCELTAMSLSDFQAIFNTHIPTQDPTLCFHLQMQQEDKEYFEDILFSKIDVSSIQKEALVQEVNRLKRNPSVQNLLSYFDTTENSEKQIPDKLRLNHEVSSLKKVTKLGYDEGFFTKNELADILGVKHSLEIPIPEFLYKLDFKEAFYRAKETNDSAFIIDVLKEKMQQSSAIDIPLEQLETFFQNTQDNTLQSNGPSILSKILLHRAKVCDIDFDKTSLMISRVTDTSQRDLFLLQFIELLIDKKNPENLLRIPTLISKISDKACQDHAREHFIKTMIEEDFQELDYASHIELFSDPLVQKRTLDLVSSRQSKRPNIHEAITNSLLYKSLKDHWLVSFLSNASPHVTNDDVLSVIGHIENTTEKERVFIHFIAACFERRQFIKISYLLKSCQNPDIRAFFESLLEAVKRTTTKDEQSKIFLKEIGKHLITSTTELFDNVLTLNQFITRLWIVKESATKFHTITQTFSNNR